VIYRFPRQGDDVDQRADVFGLGAIICEILTGLPPITGRSGGEVMRKAARGELSGAFVRLDGCGDEPELIDLTKHCLAPERVDRPRSAREVADAITAYLSGVQERLRLTEFSSVAANARGDEERKRHTLTLALAASERDSPRLALRLDPQLLHIREGRSFDGIDPRPS
jgi:hypothetical protein